MKRRRTACIAATTALAVGLVAAPAHAAPAVSGPAGFVTGYATPLVVMNEGEGVTFSNFDIAPHDFVALDVYLSKRVARRTKWCSAFEHGCPLFWSPRIGVGQSTEVLGLQRVEAGERYRFFCTLHHNMIGTLVVR
ncbi:MAG: hypothetical protein M3N53_04590 [Actinomycetota bacterium]|nr:hypothetical protein [Actinomycetota bacterium]